MTVIVFRSGVVAADTRVLRTEQQILPEAFEKIWHLADGGVGAIVGSGCLIDAAKAWLADRALSQPDFRECAVIEFLANRILVHVEGATYRQQVPLGFYVWGDGAPAALGALYMGATALEAVEVAAKVCPGVGGPFTVLRVGGWNGGV